MTRQSLRRRIERLEKLEKKRNQTIRITVDERKDGLLEWYFDNGEVELVTEAEYKARGGIIVTWQDRLMTKDERKGSW